MKETINTAAGGVKITSPSEGDASALAGNRILYTKERDFVGTGTRLYEALISKHKGSA